MILDYFVVPLLATILFIVALYPYAIKIGLTDKPCHRKQHKQSTPLIGGLAVYCAILVTMFTGEHPLPNQTAYIAAATVLVCIGIIDDYKNLGVRIRFAAQIVAVLIMAEAANIKITSVDNLFGFGDIHLGSFATAFTVFAVVGGINAFNMADGIDGLAGSLSLVSIISIAFIAWFAHDWTLLNYCLIITAALIGFLLFNLRVFGRANAKIFLGDTGSTLLGFSICWLLIDASQGEKSYITSVTVLWVIALPLIDSVCIMLRRIRHGRSPFNPDREHLHHVLILAGYSINHTLTLMVSSAFVLSIFGVTSTYLSTHDSVLFLSFMLLFTCYYWLMNHTWEVFKMSRYLCVTQIHDRRIEDQHKEYNMRSGIDRRYRPTQEQIEKFYKGYGLFLGSLLGQSFPDRMTQANGDVNESKDSNQQ